MNGEEPRRLDGQRHAARRALGQPQAALQLLQAALRPGHQPADRSDPRGAGDVAQVSLIGPKPNLLGHRRAEPAAAPRSVPAGARLLRDGEGAPHRALHAGQVPGVRARHHLPRVLGQGGDRGAPRVARRAGRGRRALGHLDHHASPTARWTASAWRSPRCSRSRRSTSTWSRRACAPRPAWWSRPARAREVHHFALLGGYGAEAVHPYLALETRAVGAHGSWQAWTGRKAIEDLRQGGRQGTQEGDVQDGHLDLHVLHRRADLRGGRVVAHAGGQVLHRHRLERRAASTSFEVAEEAMPRASRRVRRARPGAQGRARRRRRIRLARARRGARVDAGRDRQAAARLARQLVRDVQGVCRDHQRPVAAPHDVPRAVRVPLRRPAAGANRGSGARGPSSSASPREPCRSARFRPRRTPPLPSR